MDFNKDSLKIDAAAVTDQLCNAIIEQLRTKLKKTGTVIGISGGIDSSVCAALCARALGPKKVVGIMMPETDSASESAELAGILAEKFGFETVMENISAGLAGLGCYERRNEAMKMVFPDFQESWKAKIVNPGNILDKDTFNFFNLTVETDSGEVLTRRMPLKAYLQVVAASNLKQRLRMTMLYYHAELRNWAVVGTGNKDEHQQGFFVKYGDGGADMKPIAHLYKVQVYQLAEYLGVPKEIIERTPTTDTYSAEVTQEEFFFGLDFYTMDMLWHAMENDIEPDRAASVLGLSVDQVEKAYANINRKIVATEYLRMSPLEIE